MPAALGEVCVPGLKLSRRAIFRLDFIAKLYAIAEPMPPAPITIMSKFFIPYAIPFLSPVLGALFV